MLAGLQDAERPCLAVAAGGYLPAVSAGFMSPYLAEVVIIAFASAIILAIAASVIPVWYIARVRPAEVLRNE